MIFTMPNVAKRFFALFLTIALLFSIILAMPVFATDGGINPPEPPNTYADAVDDGGYIPGEVLAPADSLEHAQEIAAAYGYELESYAYGIAVMLAPEPEQAVAQSEMRASLAGADSELPALSLNKTYTLDYTAGAAAYNSSPAELAAFVSPDSALQWHHGEIDTESAWEYSTGEGVLVAVIDTGIAIAHTEFYRRMSASSYNAYSDQIGLSYVQDDTGHGTHVSGIIAASNTRGTAVCGIAPDVQLLVIKANDPGKTSFSEAIVLRGINYAVQNGADIINMSLGRAYTAGPDALEQRTIAGAVESGVTIVCAAGNSKLKHAGYPAAYPEAIAVSALKQGGVFDDSYSNYGSEIDISAPGTAVYSTIPGGKYEFLTGTSMAAPNVTGVAALVKSINPDYTQQQVRDTLLGTARHSSDIGIREDEKYGWGIVNAHAAVMGPDALFRVTYDFNDGVRAPFVVKAAPGRGLIEAHSPIRAGYIFAGWHTDRAVDSEWQFSEVITEDMTLYAKWTEAAAGTYLAEFPDQSFRYEVLQWLNTDGGARTDTSSITESDKARFASVTSLGAGTNNSFVLGKKNIRDLTGIAYFTNVKYLHCVNNKLTELDLSKNTALTLLECPGNQLGKLDLSNNKMLTELRCTDNRLEELDLSDLSALTRLYCSGNRLTKLDLSGAAVSTLECRDNLLTELDISKCTNLTYIRCGRNRLTKLDVSKCIYVRNIECTDNLLTELDLSKNTWLVELYCDSNLLTTLDVTKNIKLEILSCTKNQVTALDITKNTELSVLECAYNRLTKLDVSGHRLLTLVNCKDNQITGLDVTECPKLRTLRCQMNNMRSIDDVIGWQEQWSSEGAYFTYTPQNAVTFVRQWSYTPPASPIAAADTITVAADIQPPVACVMALALYKGDKLMAIVTKEWKADDASVSVILPPGFAAGDGWSINAFAWDSWSGMRPVCAKLELAL